MSPSNARYPVAYKSIQLDCSYRLDFLVEQTVTLEIKTVESLQPIHQGSAVDVSEATWLANRITHQFQHASTHEGHQANGQQF
jgi:GxxExxY protein